MERWPAPGVRSLRCRGPGNYDRQNAAEAGWRLALQIAPHLECVEVGRGEAAQRSETKNIPAQTCATNGEGAN